MYKQFSETEGGPCFLRPFTYNPDEINQHWEPFDEVKDTLTKKERWALHGKAWRNEFAFPWEVGMYHNLTVGGMYKKYCRFLSGSLNKKFLNERSKL